MLTAAPVGWILLDLATNLSYPIIAWTCSPNGNAVSPVVVDRNGGVGVVPIGEGTHRIFYDVRIFEQVA